jgi:hypothetical protein
LGNFLFWGRVVAGGFKEFVDFKKLMVASPEPSDSKVLRLSYVPDLLEEKGCSTEGAGVVARRRELLKVV